MAGHPVLSAGFPDMSPSQEHVRDMSRKFPTKLMTLLTHLHLIEQSDSDIETSDQPPPVFVPEGENIIDQDAQSILQLNAPEEHPPTFHLLNPMMP